MSKQIDFNTGSIIKQIILFSSPILVGELFQNLYNSVDALIVGNYLGKTALAAITSCEMPSSLLVGFFNGMSVGSSVLVAHFFGCKDHQGIHTAIQTNFNFFALAGLLLSLLSGLLAPVFLRLSGVSGEIYQSALLYLRIYMSGLVFTVTYNTAAGLLRAVGDTRTPFYTIVITCCVNIILDLFFVGVCDLGIRGAAIATVLSQLLSAFILYRKLRKISPSFHLSFKGIYSCRGIIINALRIGIPSGIQSSLVGFSNLFVWRYVNAFSTETIAGFGVAFRIDMFIGLPSKAFSLTATTMVGQTVGAGNYRRGREACVKCFLLSSGIMTFLAAVLYLFSEESVALFTADPAVIVEGVAAMHAIIPLYGSIVVRDMINGVLRGHKKTGVAMILCIVGMIVVRQAYLIITMRINFCIENVYYCLPVAWGSTALLLLAYYMLKRKEMWKL